MTSRELELVSKNVGLGDIDVKESSATEMLMKDKNGKYVSIVCPAASQQFILMCAQIGNAVESAKD